MLTDPDFQALVRASLPLFVPKEADEESVHALLVANNISDTLATQLVLFVPVAFGRAFLYKFSLTFPTTFTLHHSNGEVLPGRLFQDELVYQAAIQVAEAVISSGEWREEFHFEVAAWSPEVNIVSQALAEGCQPDAVILRELHVHGDIGMRLPPFPLT